MEKAINLFKIKQEQFAKNVKDLNNMFPYINNLYLLNSALLDRQNEKIGLYKKRLEDEGYRIEINNAALNIRNRSRLKIVYLLASTDLTGGAKILIEQSNKLAEKGHDVILLSHCPKPDWIEIKSNYMLVHPDYSLSDIVPSSDVVIAGYWSLVPEAMKINAPLKYHFAQGDFDIFEFDSQEQSLKTSIWTSYVLPLKILTTSRIMVEKLASLFGRRALIIPNALSDHFFSTNITETADNNPLKILLVGSDYFSFKGFDSVLNALQYLNSKGYAFNVNWITQTRLLYDYSKLGFTINEHVRPAQEDIVKLYRECDLYICGSFYESFCLPALEAMASGTAVITSDNGGIREYAKDGVNCLIYEPGNELMLANRLQILFDNPEKRKKLKIHALSTSKNYSWSKSIQCLENELEKDSKRTLLAKRFLRD